MIVAPLLNEMYRSVLDAGGQPVTRIGLDDWPRSCSATATTPSSTWVNPARREDIERADVRIVIEATTNTKSLSSVDPARQALVARCPRASAQPLPRARRRRASCAGC